MMFDLTEEQRFFNDQIDRFLRRVCSVSDLHEAALGNAQAYRKIWTSIVELGLGGVLVPEAHGGLGLSMVHVASISELIGYAGAPGPWLGHVLATFAIAMAGCEKQRARWLPKMTSGEVIGSVALMEGDRWHPTTWTLSQDMAYGCKDFVMGLDEAHIFVVGLAEGRLGLVEASAEGLTREPWASVDLSRPVGRLGFAGAKIEPLGIAWGCELVEAALVLSAADAQGGALRMIEDIVDYSQTRRQFGRSLSSFQSVKHKLADLALLTAPNGALYREAASKLENGGGGGGAAFVANAHIVETFSHVARTATEAYGGIGYTWEHFAHIWLRRSIFDYGWLGTPAAHREQAAVLSGWVS